MKNFEEILEEWLNYMEVQVKPSTYACYTRLSRTHIRPFFSGIPVTDINHSLIASFMTQKLEKGRIDGLGGLSEKTLKDILSIINSVLKYGEIIYGLKRPALLKWRYSNINKPIEIFSKEEQCILEKYLLHQMNRQKLGILICLYSGMRLGEICALCWNDIDLKNRVFHIRKTVQRIYKNDEGKATEIIIGTPNTQSSFRDIPIASYIWELLLTHKHLFGRNCCLISEQNRIFLDPRTYQFTYKRFLNDCGLPYRNFHALRHTFATRCIEKEMDVKSLSEILGHSNVNITLNRYVHSSLEQKRIQIEKLKNIP